MSEIYASGKQKIVFNKQQIKPSLSRRLVFAVSVGLLVSQTVLYSVGIPMMTKGVYWEKQSGMMPPVKHHSEVVLPGVPTQSAIQSPVTTESAIQSPALTDDVKNGILILVNKQNPIAKEYKPSDLTAIKYYAKDRSPNSRYMRAEAAQAFNELSESAAQQGYEIVVTTAYRSYEFQSELYNNYVRDYGQAAADTFSAPPGKSEHQTGLSADVSSPSVDYQLTKSYIDTPEGKWLSENAYKFGFIIRYPQGKEDITGYMYEPWHIRYVGKTAAEEIVAKGITLEEYLDLYL